MGGWDSLSITDDQAGNKPTVLGINKNWLLRIGLLAGVEEYISDYITSNHENQRILIAAFEN